MTHRLPVQTGAVERQVSLRTKIRTGILATLVLTAGNQAAAVEPTDSQLNPIISVIEQNLNSIPHSTSIAHSSRRFSETYAARSGTTITAGDKLLSNGGVALQIQCPDSSRISLSGRFSVQLISASTSSCDVDLSRGNLIAEANNNITVRVNGITLTTSRSVTNVNITDANQHWQVHSGEAKLQVAGAKYSLNRQSGILLSQGNISNLLPTSNDRAKSANLLARLGVTKNSQPGNDLSQQYTVSRNQYLKLFSGSSTQLTATGSPMDEQQLGIESAADTVDLSQLVVSTEAPENLTRPRRETWQLQNQVSDIGTSVSTQVQLPDTVGFIPPGAITRDF